MRAWIEYVGTLQEDGQVFASTGGQEPLEFVVGEEGTWVDDATIGLSIGESRELALGEDRPIFGPWREDRLDRVAVNKLPPGTQNGSQLQLMNSEYPVMVVEVDSEGIATVDHNHPLAGKACTMAVKLVRLEQMPESQRLVIETVLPGDRKTFPKRGDRLVMHYVGTLASSGAQFDSSRDGGEPFRCQIGVGQVIKGWDQGVMKMSVGERATLRIPARLGYGSSGAGRDIPPDADLVFDIELLAIE